MKNKIILSNNIDHSRNIVVIRGAFFTLVDNPFILDDFKAYQYESDGLIVIKDGIIDKIGSFKKIKQTLTTSELLKVTHYKDALIVPGFIDAHTHYPQTPIVASYGKKLLEWLETYTFPMENNFKSKQFAKRISDFFFKECLRAGTTTAAVFGTIHEESIEQLFTSACKINFRLIAGKVLMDRNAPKYLLEDASSGHKSTLKLIQKWHNFKRLSYAVTPRFAPTSSIKQLELSAKIKSEFPSVFIQTHLAENLDEVAWVKKLFPKAKSYLDVYDQFGLVGEKSLLAHGIYLKNHEWETIISKQATVVHCPTSNLFLGSGLFSFKQPLKKLNIKNLPPPVALGTDIGAGTSFSMLQTMSDAYKVSQLSGTPLSPIKLWYLATRGGALALKIADKVGTLKAGIEGDLVVLDFKSNPLIDFRINFCKTIEEVLFTLIVLGDSSLTKSVYVLGKKVYSKPD